jgi:hypothetical protein
MRSLYGSDGVEGIRRIDSGKTHLRTFVVATFSFCLCPCFALLCFALLLVVTVTVTMRLSLAVLIHTAVTASALLLSPQTGVIATRVPRWNHRGWKATSSGIKNSNSNSSSDDNDDAPNVVCDLKVCTFEYTHVHVIARRMVSHR